MSESEERVNWKFAHKYKENLILTILYKWRVNYVHSCFAYARIVFLFSLMDKSKSKSKRFSPYCFSLFAFENWFESKCVCLLPYCFSFVVLGIWNSNTQRLLVAILLFICCTRNLKFKHSICLLPYCFSFVVLEIFIAQQEMESS